MELRFYNTLTRQKEVFSPLETGKVSLYACGPTPYNYVHIGNLRSFVFNDLLRRWLEYKGYAVTAVMNLTDVDDKTIRDSQKEGVSLKKFTERYTEAFFEDSDALHIKRATHYPKATDHINEMVSMIKELLGNGLAYKAEDGIYFSISKFKDYGKFANVKLENLEAGSSGRVQADEYDKENVGDFALWKFWDEQDGDVFWETELGKGRPGWHIECSAMSAKHLTNLFANDSLNIGGFKTIDIHTGGIDLVFPHHQDEIAQTEGCVGKQFVKYWLHGAHLVVDGKKMSKSLGNFYTLRDIMKKGYDPLAVRYAFLGANYRQQLNFTFEALDAATTNVQRINDFVKRLGEIEQEGGEAIKEIVQKATQQFEEALSDDLEISTALAAVFDFMHEVNKRMESETLSKQDAQLAIDAMHNFDRVLGILRDETPLEPELQALIDEREEARKNKKWDKSDELRDTLKEKGIIVEDTDHGPRWKRILS